eukprot:403347285
MGKDKQKTQSQEKPEKQSEEQKLLKQEKTAQKQNAIQEHKQKKKDKKKEKKNRKINKENEAKETEEKKAVQPEESEEIVEAEEQAAVVDNSAEDVKDKSNTKDQQKTDKVKKSPEQIEEENSERKQRTTFVGNVPLETESKDLMKLFKPYGNVVKIWFRSIACDHESKITHKGKIIKKEYGLQKDSKNAYVLFKTKESAIKAAENLNQIQLGNKHLRVDTENQENDYDTTIFIGNLPWVLNDEDLRAHFEDCGKILNVRVVRDKDNFIGKGIAYVQFKTKEEMRKSIETKNRSLFRGRELRIKKAVEPRRLEKKEKKRREIKEQMKTQKKDNKRDREYKKPSTEGGQDDLSGSDNEDKAPAKGKDGDDQKNGGKGKLFMDRKTMRENAMLRIESKKNKQDKSSKPKPDTKQK